MTHNQDISHWLRKLLGSVCYQQDWQNIFKLCIEEFSTKIIFYPTMIDFLSNKKEKEMVETYTYGLDASRASSYCFTLVKYNANSKRTAPLFNWSIMKTNVSDHKLCSILYYLKYNGFVRSGAAVKDEPCLVLVNDQSVACHTKTDIFFGSLNHYHHTHSAASPLP